ncbi:hypothetical protein [Pseudonocardia sp. TRM90224]|uniref:hypothetical protein n=1 Tax=Pseudonocardia sp. TRM90224 TaxID=2812678 RepID=UPI001E3C36D5|nr:hypothetical protein [Pseudonocardia sp. TRM90224]
MAMLPWDNWIYGNDHKRDEVNNEHAKAVSLQGSIQKQIDVFNEWLKRYQTLIAGNATLVIIANAGTMSDLQYNDFRVQVKALEPPPAGSVPLQMGEMISELAAGAQLLKAVFQIGKLTKSLVTGGAETGSEELGETAIEELAETGAEAGVEAGVEDAVEITEETVGEGVSEVAAEAVVEGTSLAGLASTGIGIFAAVGIDLIFGAIDGAKEEKELDQEIDKLKAAVRKSEGYLKTVMAKQADIQQGIVKEEDRFAGLVAALAKVTAKPAGFNVDFPKSPQNAQKFIDAMRSAFAEFGDFIKLREMWIDYTKRHPDATRSKFIDSYMDFADEGTAQTTVEGYFEVLAKYSDSMRLAPTGAV